MDTKHTGQQSLHMTQEQVMASVRTMIGASSGREDDQHPLPPGPWDPVIRVALEQLRFFGPHPEPRKSIPPGPRFARTTAWAAPEPSNIVLETILGRHPELFDVIGGGHSFGDEVALNPQPLPPRFAFLIAAARAVIRRAELLQEIADATAQDGSQQGIIIVGGYTSRFSDDWCGTGFKVKWPFPGPRPHWLTHELDGIDLMVVATQFEQAAKEMFSPDLREHLAKAGARCAEAGMSRIQSTLEAAGHEGSPPTSAGAVLGSDRL